MKNPSRADAPEGFADLSIFFPDTILRAEHLHAYADRADWRCAHTSARRTTAVGGVRADMSLSTYDVTISCDTHSISPRENQSARVYRGPCRARHRFQARSRTLPLRKHHEPPRATPAGDAAPVVEALSRPAHDTRRRRQGPAATDSGHSARVLLGPADRLESGARWVIHKLTNTHRL